MNRFKPLLAALRLLTRLPLPDPFPLSGPELGRTPLFYPLAGLLIGLLLVLLNWALGGMVEPLRAALLLTAWVLLSGGLHLDGLADSADAWIGGLGDRERTLAIMKDARSGPAGVTALVLVLLVKLTALQAQVGQGAWAALLFAPLLGRTVLPLLLLSTPYVRPEGMGAEAARRLPRRAALLAVVLTAALPLTAGREGLWLVGVAAVVFVLVRAAMLRRIGGTTGDTAGALVELTEMALLVTAAAVG